MPVNVTEGFRRLALVFGLLGLVAGLIVATVEAFPAAAEFQKYSRLNKLKNDFNIRSIYRVRDAENAGVTDDEIFTVVAAHEKWNTEAILRAGYSKADVLSVLKDSPTAPIFDLFALAMFPIAGFFIPWGALRSIGWMIDGFRRP